MLEKEQEENRKMKQMLEDKDRRIAELEREVYLLNKDLEDMDDEAQKLQLENNALIRAVSQLSTQVWHFRRSKANRTHCHCTHTYILHLAPLTYV